MAIHPGLLVFLIALCSAVPCPLLQDSLARIISSTPKQATPPSSASGTRPSALPVMAATPPPSASGTRPSSAATAQVVVAVTLPPSSLQIRTLSAPASLPPASPVDVEMSDALDEMTVVLDEMSDVLRPRDSTTPKAAAGLNCKDSFSPAVVEVSAKKVAAAGVAAVGLAAPKGSVAALGHPAVAAGTEVPVVSIAAKRSRIPRFV